jgi:hypothetical protein
MSGHNPTPRLGDKKRCPSCGGQNVRAMTGAETTAYYGRETLVHARPRKCRDCGCAYEPIPSKPSCLILTGVGVLGVVLGCLVTVLGFVMCLQNLLSGLGVVSLGVPVLLGSWFAVSKYRRHLRELYGASRPAPLPPQAAAKQGPPACYLCGKPLAPSEAATRVCRACAG